MVGSPGLVQVVGGQHHRTGLALLGVDQLVDGAGRDQIQTGEWFVEQQRVVVLGDALCDEDPLSLASGELVPQRREQSGDVVGEGGLGFELLAGQPDGGSS